MALRKVPTLFYDSRTLKVSIDKERGTFYISPGLVVVGGKSIVFEGGGGNLLPPPCRIGISVKGSFTKDYQKNWPLAGENIDIQAVNNLGLGSVIDGLNLEGSTENSKCLNLKKQIKKQKYGSSFNSKIFSLEKEEIFATCEPLEEGALKKDSSFKILSTFLKNDVFYQHQFGPIYFNFIEAKGQNPKNIPVLGVFPRFYLIPDESAIDSFYFRAFSSNDTLNVEDIFLI
jgi:hypothetical protein